ncbi:unnamed protein product [Pedinophyceae sp. YPF-701]|nr:unnamed protein product [Pedinophyceae sp. YPF-701]
MGDMGGMQAPVGMEEEVFPRRRERNPHKLLGVQKDADFQEIVDAKNYLMARYGKHRDSREAIDMAYDRLISASQQKRKKKGFRPLSKRRGQTVDLTLKQRVMRSIDWSVTPIKAANKAVPFALAAATVIQPNLEVVSLALMISLVLATWNLFQKKKLEREDNPPDVDDETPSALRSPIWPALGIAAVSSAASIMFGTAVFRNLPLPASIADKLVLLSAFVGNYLAATFVK